MARISLKVEITRRDATSLTTRPSLARRGALAIIAALALFGVAGSVAGATPTPHNVPAGISSVPAFKIFNKTSVQANKSVSGVVIGGSTRVPTDAALVVLTVTVTPQKSPGVLMISPAPLGTDGSALSWETGGTFTSTVVVGVGASNKDTFVNLSAGSIALTVTVTGYTADNVSTVFGQRTGQAITGTGGTECTLGSVWLTASNRADAATMPASGQMLDVATHSALYYVLGNQFGGDSNTFALPNLQAAAPNGLTYIICVFGVLP